MGGAGYADQPNRSPWIAQMAPDGPPRPIDEDMAADVAIVGAGIAGVATAFFALRSTSGTVLLLERDRVARGATGRNAGQLTTYFERPLLDIAAEFGVERALDGQRMIDDAPALLDLLASETGVDVRVERFTGHMGMFTLNHLKVHLRNNELRRSGGLREEACLVADDAPYLREIPAELVSFYAVVPRTRIRELLETDDERYSAVLSDRKGCANSGLLVQRVLAVLEARFPGRFRYRDHSPVERVIAGDDGIILAARGHVVRAARAVLCTNGFTGHVVEDERGAPLELHPDQRIAGTIGFMAAFAEERPRTPAAMSFIRNETIGGPNPYVYVTRRTYDRTSPGDVVTLTCMGGPEFRIDGTWDPSMPYPGAMLDEMDRAVRPFAQPGRPPGQPYDFAWHGLMGYSEGRIRVVGASPVKPRLLYNLGCNGVGFLPSIAGGERIGRILAGERLSPSIFDPR